MAFCDIGPQILFIIAVILCIAGIIGIIVSFYEKKEDDIKQKWKIVLYSGIGTGIISYTLLHICGKAGTEDNRN